MKFVFFPSSCVPFHGKSLEERPLGGTETAVIRLSEVLSSLGHQVFVLTSFENPPLTQPLYLPLRAIDQLPEVDVVVAVREWLPLFYPIKAKKFLFWTGDAYDQPQTVGLGDKRIASKIDAFLAVSNWQADTLCNHSGFPRDKVWVIRNGIHLPFFQGSETRYRKRLIYSSTPYRGLKLVPPLYLALKEKHSDLQLHIFSGYKVYAGPQGYDSALERQYEQLSLEFRKLPHCFVHGNVMQRELAREFMRASILFYPNTFPETSCITAMEAQAAGCTIVTTNMAGLQETVGEAGVLIHHTAGSDAYNKEFVEAADRILSDDAVFEWLSQAGLKQAREFDWINVAKRLLEHLYASP